MEIDEKYKNLIKLMNNNEAINNDTLGKLLENCCKALSGRTEVYDLSALSQHAAVEIKQIYAALLYIFTQFVRNGQVHDEFLNFLATECDLDKERAKIMGNYYEKWYEQIRIQLLNIGCHLPHITDVKCKINYIVKSKSFDQSDGPIFRVSLKTEKYDHIMHSPKVEFIDFTCNSLEMQDLIYKLKDAVRHCQKLAAGHYLV